ncbi:hypothetical protein [Natrinema altunense]|uniref:Uncharacterized protein n=1 Tax=Natrinema altunense (strain JCM 12890 / CGMCC 1.3731 / AJ2) TaxID=1227494 RepID=L9ZE61_NATA2|nr:hypothetical protein [Natrinema altunense]ELY84659.1 hypothetical protein C485_14915 [Natrinema altunense JCM 12890]
MSAERRGSDFTVPADHRTRIDRSRSTLESNRVDDGPSRHATLDSGRRELPLSYEIERTRLHARIAALEDALETSETRRQAVIDRYERLLAERAESSRSPSNSRTLLSRLVNR